MNGAILAERLADLGLEASELPAKALLYDSAVAAFRELTGAAPTHAWWVPGRVEVFGKHTDYAGGRSLVAAVPRGFGIVCGPRLDRKLRVVDARRLDSVMLRPDDDSAALGGWRRYVEVVFRRIERNFPAAVRGIDIVFASDLPRASGMSSSSALVVGVAAALVRVAHLDAHPEWHNNIHGPLDAAGYYACIENGSTFGTLSGDAGVGTHGGSEDHAAILCGVPQYLSAYAFVPLRHMGDVRMPERWRFVIASSGVSAEKTGAAQAAYNELARGAQVLLELWNHSETRCPSLAAALASSAAAPDHLRDLIRGADVAGWRRDDLERRLEHFLREDARVADALTAFRDADTSRVGMLAEGSQEDAESLIRNQVVETAMLARSGREAGAFAACSFGAGFGGSVWALVERDAVEEFGDGWVRRYHARQATGPKPVWFAAAPGPPLTELA